MNVQNIKTYILSSGYRWLLILLLPLASCEKYLDIKPKGYVIPQTVEEYERILNNSILTKMLSDGIERLADDFYDPSLVLGKSMETPDYRLYFWLPSPYSTPTDYLYYSYWDLFYKKIYQYNAIINGVDQATGGTEKRKAILKGRALVGRSICYFYLANLYAQPYDASTASSALGVPLVTSNSLNDKLPARSTVEETFDFILKGFEEGIEEIPISSLTSFELNQAGAYGWLARTYLTMKQYDKAADAAGKALNINDALVDYNKQYEMYQPAEGPAIYIPKNGHIFATPAQQPENLHIIYFDYTRGMAFQNVASDTEALFGQSDLRRMNLVPSYVPYGASLAEWDRTYIYMGYRSYEYSAGPTTPEMYLIRAEGAAREGNLENALKALNLLRKNRIIATDYEPIQSAEQKQVLTEIYNERRRELLFKGLRWFDMRRLNSDPEFGFTAEHALADGTTIELQPGSPRYVLTIPDPAVTDEIVQNP